MVSVVETTFSPTSPHFFTIILHETLRNNKLQIPKKILRKCGTSLRDEVFLKLPCGSKWKLGLTKSCEGKVWMDKGWPEFSKKYSIGRGYLLVFRYEGDSQFHVVIFDTTTTEIDYPLEKHIGTETPKHEKFVEEEEICNDGTEDDISVENLDCPFPRPCSKTRDKPPFLCYRPQKRTRNSPVKGGGDYSITTSKHALAAHRNLEARKIVSAFQSENPFFTIIIHPSYKTQGPVSIPANFARTYLENEGQIGLCVSGSDGRSWSVQYRQRRPDKRVLQRGWLQFVRESGLEEGDICTFELTNRDELSFKVHIVKVAREEYEQVPLAPQS